MKVTVLKLVIFHISVKNVRANAPAAHTNVTILLDVLVCYIYTRINSFKTVFSKSMTGCIFCHFRKNQSFKIYTSVIWCNSKPYGINIIKVWRVFFFQNITKCYNIQRCYICYCVCCFLWLILGNIFLQTLHKSAFYIWWKAFRCNL